jgi:hypothetical protein
MDDYTRAPLGSRRIKPGSRAFGALVFALGVLAFAFIRLGKLHSPHS